MTTGRELAPLRLLCLATALGLGVSALTSFAQTEVRTGGSVAERVRALLDEAARDDADRALTARASENSSRALDRAGREGDQAGQRVLLEELALEWAEVARDLQRARATEQASDKLEREVAALQTEIARARASVEQARARVGRARQELRELSAGLPAPAKSSTPATPPASERPAQGSR